MNDRSSAGGEVQPPSLRERIRLATAGAILGAAEQVFAEQGLQGARMNDIAARAGMAVGTLYNHFKDRDALLAGLIDFRRVEALEQLDAAMAVDGPFPVVLQEFLSRYMAYYISHKPFFQIYLQGELVRPNNHLPQASAKAPEFGREIYGRFCEVVRRGVDSGELEPQTAEYYPAILMGMLRGCFIREKLMGGKGELPPVHELVRFFLKGAAV
jgi:AcrR family transcriptional regulator